MLTKIKVLLGITDNEKDAVLQQLVEMYSGAISLHAGTAYVPVELEFVLVECVITRYNRIGSEGLESESVDVVSFNYKDGILESYMGYIDAYKASVIEIVPKKPRVRML